MQERETHRKVDGGCIRDSLKKTGIDKPAEQFFKGKTDRGSKFNMIKGYENLPHDACTDHLIESDITKYTEDPCIK